MAHYHRARPPAHGRHPRRGGRARGPELGELTETHPIGEVALISDASNKEIHRLNARAQHYRAERGELGELEVEVPGVHYGVRAGRPGRDDRPAPRARRASASRTAAAARSSTSRGRGGADRVRRDRPAATLAGEDLARLRLGYAQHIHRAQGATVTRTLVVTGGWQTSKEPAYVEASRARQGTDWYVTREDLGVEGHDTDRIERLAQNMRRSHAQTPSLAHPELPDPDYGPGFTRTIAPSRHSRLPGIARAIHRIAKPQPSTGANTMSRRIQIALPPGPAALQLPARRREPDHKFVGRSGRLAVIKHMVSLSKKRKGERLYGRPARPDLFCGDVLLTKKQLAAHLGRSARWVELKVREGMPVEQATDRYGRRRYNLRLVETWLHEGRPKAVRHEDRLAVLERRVAELAAQVAELSLDLRASARAPWCPRACRGANTSAWTGRMWFLTLVSRPQEDHPYGAA